MMRFSKALACAMVDRLDLVDVDTRDVDEVMNRPDCFIDWSGDDRLFDTWCLGPIVETRDSGIIDQSNAAMLKKRLEEYGEEWEDEWYVKGASHWACGWVDHLCFRARDDDGGPTPIFRFVKQWFDALSEYPIANEEDVGEREMEALFKHTSEALWPLLVEQTGAIEDAVGHVLDWIESSDEYQHEAQDHDGHGACPSDDALKAACRALGYALEEDEDE